MSETKVFLKIVGLSSKQLADLDVVLDGPAAESIRTLGAGDPQRGEPNLPRQFQAAELLRGKLVRGEGYTVEIVIPTRFGGRDPKEERHLIRYHEWFVTRRVLHSIFDALGIFPEGGEEPEPEAPAR